MRQKQWEFLRVVKIKIAVLYNVSKSKNTKEVESNLLDMAKSVAKALMLSGHRAILVNADDKLVSAIRKEKPDIVFNLAERFNGNSDFTPHVAALLEMHKIPFTGASSRCFTVCDDKIMAKVMMRHYGIKTPRFQVFESEKDRLSKVLKFPLIVKPCKTHDSIGITNDSVVYSRKQLRLRVKKIMDTLKQKVIVEEYIKGREFNVTVLGNKKPYTLPICEVDFSKNSRKVLGYEMKWHIDWYKEAPIICPANLPRGIESMLKRTAINAHKKFKLRDYSRIDVRLDENNKPYVLEINVNPGLTEDCFIFSSAKAAGIGYAKLIARVLGHAAERYNIPTAVRIAAK